VLSPIGVTDFETIRQELPVLDVRSPSEYTRGHVPGAVNLPLFSDEERARVGTLYKRSGREAALLLGLDCAGGHLSAYVRQALKAAPGKRVLMHCWRGGMRSEGLGWLLSLAGFDVSVLEGGYKAYRRHIAEAWQRPARLLVLSGKTGTGKTAILQRLQTMGEQVLDLEHHAHHKGSAFGALGQPPQPTNEQFENNLAQDWLRFDSQRPVWTEDESRNIGSVTIPAGLFRQKEQAVTVCLDMPLEARVERLVGEYAGFTETGLQDAILRIRRRLGDQRCREALQAVEAGDFHAAARHILHYYDKTYAYDLEVKQPGHLVHLPAASADPADNALMLRAWAASFSHTILQPVKP